MEKLNIKIVFIILLGTFQSNIYAQSFPIQDLVGQYPLRGEVIDPHYPWKRFEIQPWDISLEGNHAKVEVVTDEPRNRAFELIHFKGTNYVKGKAKGKIQLKKDPFESYLGSFTIAFWIEKGASGRILQTNLLQINMSPTNELSIHWKNNISTEVGKFQINESLQANDGWYNLAVVYDKSLNKMTIYINDIPQIIFTITSPLTKRYDYNASLMSLSDFRGGLANVSFAKAAYDANQLSTLNEIMTDNKAYAKRRFRYYPLDYPDLKRETVNQKNAILVKQVETTSDRNNEPSKAAYFNGMGSIILPYLFGENPVTDSYDETLGITISLWMKIEIPESTPQQGATPVINPLEDRFYSILYGIDDEYNAKAPIFGLQRVRDRIGINTYIERLNNTKLPVYNWFYDPVDFRNKTGWFHVIYVQQKYFSKTYLVKNDEMINCNCDVRDWVCWRNCQMHYDYTSFLPIDDIKEWGLGSWGVVSEAHAIIDDLSIYRWPMDVEQVTALHSYETYNSSSNKKTETTKQEEISFRQELGSVVLLTPNPSNGTFSLDFDLKKDSPAQVEIVNLTGQLVFKKNYTNLIKGNYTLRFDENDIVLLEGIYIIKVITNEFNESNKLIIQ